MSQERIGQAYSAAELFHLPARYFNDALVQSLENNGIQVFSPQRDGFEFSQLTPALAKYLPPNELESSLNILIYAYDLKSIWNSDILIARFDEPSDPGVDAEVLFANIANIPVIAYRTDVRSPYGNVSEKFAGMHTFPIKESQVLIIQNSSNSSKNDFEELVQKITIEAKNLLSNFSKKDPQKIPPTYQEIFNIAEIIFKDINIHTNDGLIKIAQRCMENIDLINNFGPRVVR
jgi:nucleoside 2-deoxyribosyltransferase